MFGDFSDPTTPNINSDYILFRNGYAGQVADFAVSKLKTPFGVFKLKVQDKPGSVLRQVGVMTIYLSVRAATILRAEVDYFSPPHLHQTRLATDACHHANA